MERLKPCPFCGKPVSMFYSSMREIFEVYHANAVDDLDCCIIETQIDSVSLEDATKAWNRRTNSGN